MLWKWNEKQKTPRSGNIHCAALIFHFNDFLHLNKKLDASKHVAFYVFVNWISKLEAKFLRSSVKKYDNWYFKQRTFRSNLIFPTKN